MPDRMATGRIIHSGLPRSPRVRRADRPMARCQGSCRISCTPMIGRPVFLPAYLRFDGRRHAPSVITVHNLAFQGQFSPSILSSLGLPPDSYAVDGVEYYGSIGFLKAGLALADRVTTVSPTYAEGNPHRRRWHWGFPGC